MKKVLSVFLALVAVVTLVACDNTVKPSTGVGYGLVHKHYVGKATLTVDGEGLVTEAKLDEYYLPYNIANVTGQVGTYKGVAYGLVHKHYVGMVTITTDKDVVTDAEIDEYYLPYNLANLANQTVADGATDAVSVVGASSTTVYAKYFSAGGTLWTSKGANAWFATIDGKEVNIEDWVKTPANAKVYAEACDNDKIFIANSDGTKHASYKTQYEIAANNANTDNTAKTGVARYLKSTTGYGGTRWDWQDAMDKLVDLFKGSKMDANLEDAAINDDGFWNVGGVVTDSTLVDFKDYYTVGVNAYKGRVVISGPTDTFIDGTKLYAKYVKVGDVLFTGSTGSSATDGTPVYSASGITDIEQWVKTPANAKAYAEACDSGNVFLATSAGAKHASYKTYYEFANNLTGVSQFLKSTTGYGGTKWDWKDAMDKLEKLFKGSKMNLNMADADTNDDGFWVIGDLTTDSTLVDFKDYYAVGLTAYNDAIANRNAK
ncbi:hypothetical protein LJC17_00730 [Acholeplasma sp. OttesenSCG-928-E16]|nr:hypothetical protein [Acholeplasma sp. OttesenSCG-928-E16]